MPKLLPFYTEVPSEPADGQFDYGQFRSALLGKALWMWRQYGMLCPCNGTITVGPGSIGVTVAPYTAKSRCRLCNGEGRIYQGGHFIPAMMWDAKQIAAYSQVYGLLQPGDIAVSVLRECALGLLDRLVMVSDATLVWDRIQVKALNEPLRPRFPVVQKRLFAGTAQVQPCAPAEATYNDVGVVWARYSDAQGEVVGAADAELVEGDGLEVDYSTGLVVDHPVPVGGFLSMLYHTYPVLHVGSVLKEFRVTPVSDGRPDPLYGDGPAAFALRASGMNTEVTSNPTATYLPPPLEL